MGNSKSPEFSIQEQAGTSSTKVENDSFDPINFSLLDSPTKQDMSSNSRSASPSDLGDGTSRDKPLPHGWEMRKSKDGRKYYVDHNTKTTTWDHPLSARTSESSGSAVALTNGLPAGWESREDSDGKTYYVDHTTRTTSWVRPLACTHETTRPLPCGWERRRTTEGRLYFVDHNDKKTTWVPPWDTGKEDDSEAGTELGNVATEVESANSSPLNSDTPKLDSDEHSDKTERSLEEDGWEFVSKL